MILGVDSKKPNRYKDQIGSCQEQGVVVRELGEGGQKVKISSTRWVSSGDVMYSVMTIVNTICVYLKVAKESKSLRFLFFLL